MKDNNSMSESIPNFNKVEAYSYEMILKEETKNYLKNFDESASRKNGKEGTKFSSTYFGRDFTNIIHEWELKNGLAKCWERIDEFDKFAQFDTIPNTSEMGKPYVKEFKLFLIEIPYLPYDLVIIKTVLDENKIQKVIDTNDQLNILMSINDYFDRFPSIIKKTMYGGKHRPCYLKLDVNVENSWIDNKLTEIKTLEKNKELKNESELVKYYDASQKLRIKYFDPNDIDHKMMSVFVKGKSISVLGFLEGFTNEIRYNNYEISFNPKDESLMWATHTAFHNQIDYNFSNQIHFISIAIFLIYILRKLDDYEVNFTTLISKYKTLKSKNSNEKKEFYHQLNNFEEELFFVKSDLEKIDFVLQNPLNETMKSIRTYNLISPKQFETKYNFSEGMLKTIFDINKNELKRIEEKLSNLQHKGSDLKNKFEKDIVFDNTLSMNKYSKRNLWLTISMLVLSAIVTGQIIYNIVIP